MLDVTGEFLSAIYTTSLTSPLLIIVSEFKLAARLSIFVWSISRVSRFPDRVIFTAFLTQCILGLDTERRKCVKHIDIAIDIHRFHLKPSHTTCT